MSSTNATDHLHDNMQYSGDNDTNIDNSYSSNDELASLAKLLPIGSIQYAMVCGNHFKIKYVRFLIKHHLLIYILVLIMTIACLSYFVYKRDQYRPNDFLRGFQVHGTKLSTNYRTFIALLRETQTKHLYPTSPSGNISSEVPYEKFEPHVNPCSKRFHLSECPILSYTEITFGLKKNFVDFSDDLLTFESICKLEENLRSSFTSCSNSTFCCHFTGPVGFLVDDQRNFSSGCNEIESLRDEWRSCQSSVCANRKRSSHFRSLSSEGKFRIYLDVGESKEKLVALFDYLYHALSNDQFQFQSINAAGANQEEILFEHILKKNIYVISSTCFIYLLCLIFFVKNTFFLLNIFIHMLFTCGASFLIYRSFFHNPLTIFNLSSLIFYVFLVLIDSILWYLCWTINNRRRDDCTIHRIIENLVTQAFFYLLPKNFAAILILLMTFVNRIIALQRFTALTIFFISISFLISFVIYPVSFIFILRYHSLIPTLERITSCLWKKSNVHFLDRTIPFLIVRLKIFWLILLTVVCGLACFILFRWPTLEFDVCRIHFDALPKQISSTTNLEKLDTIDLDVTYYIGSPWVFPVDSWIPLNDIPVLNYNEASRMSALEEETQKFSKQLKTNFSKFVNFCKFKSFQDHRHSINSGSVSCPNNNLSINTFPCFADYVHQPMINRSMNNILKFSSIVNFHYNSTVNCRINGVENGTEHPRELIPCVNSLFYQANPLDDLFLIKNGLRFINNPSNPTFLLQTVYYRWNNKNKLNHFQCWKSLINQLETSPISQFFSRTFSHMSWWSSELISTYTIMEQLYKEQYYYLAIKFTIVLIFLTLFTGVLGIFVTLTTLLNFLTCIATLTLFNYKITVENVTYFVISLIMSLQYSVLYSISYKLAPTFFFQRENRMMYSIKQLCTTLSYLTFSIVLISVPCLFSTLPYLFKTSLVYIVSSSISLIFSTFFLQSLLCLFGPAGHSHSWISWRFTCTRRLPLHRTSHSNLDSSIRGVSSSGGTSSSSRRHHRHWSHPRMSTSSHFASSYFSQIFTGSTYFESDYGATSDVLTMMSRRRESSRSHTNSHAIKRNSLLTADHIELYTPRTSLAPHHFRYSRQSSVPRGFPPTALARPLYVSSSISPFSQLSIQSQVGPRQRSPSPNVYRPSRSPSPSPCSFISPPFSPPIISSTPSLRPCSSAPRLHAPVHRRSMMAIMDPIRQNDTVFEEMPSTHVKHGRKPIMTIQRQDAILSNDDEFESELTTSSTPLSASARRTMLKATTIESGGPVWLKRSSSS